MIWLLVAAVVYYVLPYVFIKTLNVGVIRSGAPDDSTVALTFDDGPDPLTTPRVLDVLRDFGVKATFFVKGDAAEAYPDLVRRLIDDGHEIGSHGYRHKHAFLCSPWEAYDNTLKGVERLCALTGERLHFFRPPHGGYAWPTWWAIRKAGVMPVHWTLESHDWHPDYPAARVVARVLGRIVAGDVVDLHDGRPGGARTVDALAPILQGLRSRGLDPVPLGKMRLFTGRGRCKKHCHDPANRSTH